MGKAKSFFNKLMRKSSRKDELKKEISHGAPEFFHSVAYRTMISGTNLKYPLPTSVEESNWIEDHHYFLRHMWQGNFSAPIEDLLKKGGAKVLYVGCHSEKWVLETSKQYPDTKFIGIITRDFTSSSTNAAFYKMNLLEGLPFADNEFDLVFVRMVSNPFTEKEWEENIIKEVVRLTKHNGWLELMPTDNRVFNTGPSFEKWNNAVMDSLKLKGLIHENLHNFLSNTNQISKQSHQIMLGPVGSWGNKAGELGVAYFNKLSIDVKSVVIDHLDMTEEEYTAMMREAEEELKSYKTYSFSHRFIAQKK